MKDEELVKLIQFDIDNITNFYNVMRIRGELPFMERDNTIISIDMTNEITFEKS